MWLFSEMHNAHFLLSLLFSYLALSFRDAKIFRLLLLFDLMFENVLKSINVYEQ